MIIAGSKKFIAAAFASEEELELIVQASAEYIFGPSGFPLFGKVADSHLGRLACKRQAQI